MSTKTTPDGVAIAFDPAKTPVGYANVVLITHSPYEFFLDFALIQPGAGGNVMTRFVSSPVHAKKLAEALTQNVAMYEQRYGPIKDPAPPPPPPAAAAPPWGGPASPPPGFS